jgi:N-acetylglucosaminyldiphosphoundecaprenol N-acetyl-beta-D-mannosaminyltransferase
VQPEYEATVQKPKDIDRKSPGSFTLLGTKIASMSFPTAISEISRRVNSRQGTTLVHFTTVHMLIESVLSDEFGSILRSADINFPDGMPLVWLGTRAKSDGVSRVCGPEFMPAFCRETAHLGYRHFFYGGAPGVAEQVIAQLKKETPDLQVAGHYCPPFRALTPEEDRAICQQINDSGADLVWVCLGCPAQERWIHDHRKKLNARVLLAVGAAFDVVAGRSNRAPKILRNYGLEWCYRLLKEPRRLWRRYLVYNSFFLYLMLKDSLLVSDAPLAPEECPALENKLSA